MGAFEAAETRAISGARTLNAVPGGEMRAAFLSTAVMLLSGCVYIPYYPTAAPQHSSTYSSSTPRSATQCYFRALDVTSAGETVPSSYQCILAPGIDTSTAGCYWVDAYARRDGSQVSGHTRCATDVSLSTAPMSSVAPTTGSYGSSDRAPCVTGYCGSVSVKGYYRKDGTYVRPHTRSRPRR